MRRSGKRSGPVSSIAVDGAYAFVHDRVQEAAYALIPEHERALAHLRIGRLLASETAPDERDEKIFDIVNQLNGGAALIQTPKEREQVAELNLIAGKRAKSAAAYSAALQYFSKGYELAGRKRLGAELPIGVRPRAQFGRVRIFDGPAWPPPRNGFRSCRDVRQN